MGSGKRKVFGTLQGKGKVDWQSFLLDCKKFVWYIVTEPFRRVHRGLDIMREGIRSLQRIRAWIIIYATLALLCLFAGKMLAAQAFAICFLAALFHHEWKKGFFRKRWKDKEKKRLIKKMLEVDKDGLEQGNRGAISADNSGDAIRSGGGDGDQQIKESDKNKV